jgi:hypothetical protein
MNEQKSSQPYIQALVWYEKKHWETIRNMMIDSHLIPPTYDQWLAMAKANFDRVKEDGDVPVKVFIEPEGFAQWCAEHNRQKDAEGRTTFAIQSVTQQQFGSMV